MTNSSTKNRKLLVLGALMLCALIGGIGGQLVDSDRFAASIEVAFLLLGAFLLFVWFCLDSDERGYRRSPLLNVGVVALAIVVLPYYFFRTRGFVGGLAATMVFLVAGITYTLLQFAGVYLALLTGHN